MTGKINAVFSRWGLAVACIVAPIVLGVLVNGVFVSWLTAGSEFCAITRQLSFTLIGETKPSPRQLSAAAGKQCDEAMARRAKEAAPLTLPAAQPAPVTVAPPAAAAPAAKADADKPSPQLQLLANHAAGRLNVAYGYAFLTVVSVLAFAFGSFVVISKHGWKRWAVVAAIFGGVTVYLTQVDLGRDGLRHFVADNILARADAHVLLQYLPASDNLRLLITFGLCMGYWSVGLVLASLFLASIRKMNHATLPDLKERLFIIRAGLILVRPFSLSSYYRAAPCSIGRFRCWPNRTARR